MDRLTRAISQLFVVLVLLFGSPPPVSLRQFVRRPTIALVTMVRRRADGDPLVLAGHLAGPEALAGTRVAEALFRGRGQPWLEGPPVNTGYPVRAA